MKILVLAPHPFYQERGTPIAVDLLLRALSERGDDVHLLTYHEGDEKHYKGLKIHRIRPRPVLTGIPPGFSAKKLWCDVFFFFRLLSLVYKERYDVVHAVEESAFMAMLACPRRPFIYDMDSCMTTQLVDKYHFLKPAKGLLEFIESLPMRRAALVLPVCDSLAEVALRYRQDGVEVLHDISLLDSSEQDEEAPDIRSELGIKGNIAMYIGNLESYQGIDFLLEAFATCLRSGGQSHLVVIGGSSGHVDGYRKKCIDMGIGGRVHFLGKRPLGQMAAYMRQATILVSPRIQGVNTPMKIYSYLHSGRPVLATRLPTHTQIMSDETAMLAEADAHSFGLAMARLLEDEPLQRRLAERARDLIEAEHSYTAYRDKVHAIYDRLERQRAR